MTKKKRPEDKVQTGRPTLMDAVRVAKLEEAFALGCTDLEACFFADISKHCLYDYQQKNPEFVDRKESLKARPILLARSSVVNALGQDPKLSLSFLECKLKSEFGRSKADVIINADGEAQEDQEAQIVINVCAGKRTSEEEKRD